MKRIVILITIFLVVISLCQVSAQVRCLATKSVDQWNIQTANEVVKWFVENRQEIDSDFFRYEFYSDSEDLVLVFVKYEIDGDMVLQEVVLRKEEFEGRKRFDVLFCGERSMFLEYCVTYGYDYDEVKELYRVQDSY